MTDNLSIASLNVGDKITALFHTDQSGEFEITGTVRATGADWWVGGRRLLSADGFQRITAHTPTEPPVGVYTDEFASNDYWVHIPEGWISIPASQVRAAVPWEKAPHTYTMTAVDA